MQQSSQMLQYFDKLPTFNFNNAKISRCFIALALWSKIRLKWKIYVNYAKFCIEVFPDAPLSQILVCTPHMPLVSHKCKCTQSQQMANKPSTSKHKHKHRCRCTQEHEQQLTLTTPPLPLPPASLCLAPPVTLYVSLVIYTSVISCN